MHMKISTTPDARYAHIEKPPGDSARLKNTPRMRVSMIISAYLAHGYSPEEMCRQFPHMSLSEAYSAMAYYFDHQEEIDEEIERELREYESIRAAQPPSPILKRLRELGLR